MKRYIRMFDYIGNRVGMKINDSFYYQSTVGGCLSIFLAILTLVGIINFGLQIFTKTNLKVINTSNYEPLPSINITGRFPFMVNVVKRGAYPLENFKSYYNVSLINYNQINTNGMPVVTLTEKRMRICQEEDFQGRKDQFLQVANPSDPSLYYCLANDENIELYGYMGTRKVNYLAVLIKRCVNGTDIICKPKEVIDAQFANMFIQFIASDYYFDSTNYEHPGQAYFKSTNIPITSNFYKRAYMYYHNVDYTTDKGILLQNELTQNYYQFDSYKEVIFFDKSAAFTPDTLAEVSLSVSVIKSQFNRYGYKLQNLAADVGGIIKTFLIIFQFIVELLNRNYLNVKIVNEIFSFKKVEEPLKIQGKFSSMRESKDMINNKGKTGPIINTFLETEHPISGNTLPKNDDKKKIKYSRYLCCLSFSNKKKVDFSQKVINKTLNVCNLIATLNEVQAQKNLLFNKDQIILMDYMLKDKFLLEKPRVDLGYNLAEVSWNSIKQRGEAMDKKILNFFKID